MNNNQSGQQKTYKLAVISFILSLLFFVPFAPCLGVILGVIVRRRFVKAPHRLKGKGQGLAEAAIIIGIIFGLLSVMVLAAIVPFNIIRILFLIALAISVLGAVYFRGELWSIFRVMRDLDLKEHKLEELEETLSEKEDLKKHITEAKAHIEQERMRIIKQQYPGTIIILSLLNFAFATQIKTITQAVIIFGIPILLVFFIFGSLSKYLQKRMIIQTIPESRKETILRIITVYLGLVFIIGLIVVLRK